jgi:hypothetical protein
MQIQVHEHHPQIGLDSDRSRMRVTF